MTAAALAAAAHLGSQAGSGPGCGASSGGAGASALCTAAGSLHIPVAYRSILVVLVLSGGALAALALSAVLPKRSRPGLYPATTAVTGALALAAGIWQWQDVGNRGPQLAIGRQVMYDRFGVLFAILVATATILGALTSDRYLREEGLDGVEAYVLMLMAATGAVLMALSAGFVMLFLGLEIMSISLYVLAAFHRRRLQSGEAGLKYFLLGAFSSAIFLYGVALIYGATGSTQFDEIATFLSRDILVHSGVLLAGMALVLVGLGFKVAAVPFHSWAPDVYQGTPTPFTGFMAAVAKAAGFAGLLRVLEEALGTQQSSWRPAVWVLAVLTLAVGSTMAIAQRDLKRMFAYSSISQAGYVLVGLQAANRTGEAGALFYLFTYTFIIIGTFAVVSVVQGPGERRTDLGAITGLGRRQPLLAAALLVFLLAQAGVPFTTGFLAKFYVIQAAVSRGQYYLAVIAMLAAAVAAFFYLRVALLMYGRRDADEGPAPPDGSPEERGGAAGVASLAGLEPLPAMDGPGLATALQAPPRSAAPVPLPVAACVAVCAAFTVAAGVSSPMIDVARHATALFHS